AGGGNSSLLLFIPGTQRQFSFFSDLTHPSRPSRPGVMSRRISNSPCRQAVHRDLALKYFATQTAARSLISAPGNPYYHNASGKMVAVCLPADTLSSGAGADVGC
ncbi:hypothetical protein BaRGS_00037286, partial [Batillaria attramentaria]